jgi:hypothetical protein
LWFGLRWESVGRRGLKNFVAEEARRILEMEARRIMGRKARRISGIPISLSLQL